MSLLKIEKCTVVLNGREILQDVGLTAEAGELTGILGPNGCGKTTLLKAACGLIPAEGTFLLDGKPYRELPERRRARLCRYLPQKSGTELHLSVRETVLTGFNPVLGLWEMPTPSMKEAADALLRRLLPDVPGEKDFMTLSEGQRHLVLLARVLVCGSKAVFLDEPESALDFGTRGRMLEEVKKRVAEEGSAAVFSLHDPQLALSCCDRLLLMKHGRAAAVLRPAEEKTADVEEAMRMLYGPLRAVLREDGGRKQFVLLREYHEDRNADHADG